MKIHNGVPIPEDIPALTAEGRSLAKAESRSCSHCGSEGLAIVDASDSRDRTRACAATCVCKMGKWLRAWHRTHEATILERIPDLALIKAGIDRRWTYDTCEYEEPT